MKKILILTLLVLAISGCSDDDPVTPPDPPAPIAPFAGSAPQLMANFKTAYESMDLERHRVLLHPDFMTVLQQETIDQFPDVGETLDLFEEIRIHQRMFSGENLIDPDGQFIPGMQDVDFRLLFQLEDWTGDTTGEWPTGTVSAPHEVDVVFSRGPEYSQMRVRGVIVFYAVARDSVHEGETRDYYEMVGQVDLTGFQKGSETGSWGAAKALYR